MKIALYGSDKTELEVERDRIVQGYAKGESQKDLEIFCIQDEEEMRQTLKDYHMILVEQEGIREFKNIVFNEKDRKKVTISAGKEMGFFYVDDIFYVEAELSKTHFMTVSGEFVVALTITEAEELLREDGFIKIHRSYLVNANRLKEIKRRTAILDNGKELPISKYRLQQVREQYLEIVGNTERKKKN